ncbi:MAG: outer membrane protein assembly factor BamD [Bacteroidales bacterium]|nr:outer membrane protein assembly factor BamD [Bacteroidales bacterium]MDD4669698.1 outer membrane protein assembly factor BamD [Bacteroidales bacterium]
MRLKLSVVLLLSVLASVSCKTQYDLLLEGNDVDAKYQAAFKLFEAKKYLKAAEMFESLSLATKGTAQDDTVQFYWGYSNYKYGDYTIAENNLSQFIQVFPVSPFTEYAKYLRIDCLYRGTYRYELDQMPTYKALSVINEFIVENPQSEYVPRCREMVDNLNERLEMKAYKSAYLYYHMEDYLAAHYALKNVLKDNANNRYREEILYYTALSAYKYALLSVQTKQRERYLTFIDDYYNIVSEYPESQYKQELDGLYEKVQKILKKQ